MTKKCVHYVGSPSAIFIGHPCFLFPVDHPDSERVTNLNMVRTSNVVSYDVSTGRIETENTIYIPEHDPSTDPWSLV